MPPAPASFLPLKPVELHILLALADGDLHGYGLTLAVAERSEGLIRLAPGNLYQVLKRLLADDLIAEAPRAASHDDGRRRLYRLTALGGRVAAAELARLRALTQSAAATALRRKWAT
ncbi:MAG TPA: PadR family transcriptional regulator [Gemmatimonadaceae bacterium]